MTFIRSPICGHVINTHKKFINQIGVLNIRRCQYHVCIFSFHSFILRTKQSATCRLMVELEFQASGSLQGASPGEFLRAGKVFFTSNCFIRHLLIKIVEDAHDLLIRGGFLRQVKYWYPEILIMPLTSYVGLFRYLSYATSWIADSRKARETYRQAYALSW
jgi:hypothetical protein